MPAGADGRLAAFTANGALWRLQQTAWSNGWSEWLPHDSPGKALVVGPVTAGRSGDGRIQQRLVELGLGGPSLVARVVDSPAVGGLVGGADEYAVRARLTGVEKQWS